MKKILFVFALTSAIVSCKKEASSPSTSNTSNTSNTDSTKTTTNVSSDGKLGATISDVDGNTYKTVIIGDQQWMAENLKVTKFNDGTGIPNASLWLDWSENDTTGWCNYYNKAEYNAKNGKLYNWNVVSPVKNGEKNVCPKGWHVPNDAEWDKLGAKLGGVLAAGAKLKVSGTADWNSPNPDATNSSLFSAYPSGVRNSSGSFEGLGNVAQWWSADEQDYMYAKALSIYYINSQFSLYSTPKRSGASIRCIKD
jgi:uncharacterized protein (TIGR02145 family)